ncbi:MAG: molybdate ABC transporter substrate-binding protein [Burkholderiales bacterium]|nr:molybdate ABC transporter substrate-binding protein [Burkholderiales bacterium]
MARGERFQRARPAAAGERIRRRVGTFAVLAALLGLLHGGLAWGADLRVFCPNALRAPVLELARSFARGSGQRVEFIFASVGAIHKRMASGERADVAIGTGEGVDALVKLGPGIDGTQTPIVHSVLAIALPADRRAVNVESASDVTQLLRDATSIVAPDPRLGVPGGAQVQELIERLGLTEELSGRIRWLADAREVAKRVASGAAALGIATLSDIAGVPGVSVAGPLRAPATRGVVYAALVIKSSTAAEQARGFIAHLRTAEAAEAFRKAGYGAAQ